MQSREPLAIVGIGCRLPGGADGPDELWRMLCQGRDAIAAGPRDDARRAAFERADVPPDGGFLPAVDGFDRRAFGLSPREARCMDPQQRLALEVAWEAFEHAGIPFDALAGSRTTVAVGIMWPDYARLQARAPGPLDPYGVGGGGFAYAANRISAHFDLVGPSLAVDAMSASSLAAVHLACQSLWCGEAELALAAGVSLMVTPDTSVALTRAGLLARDGRCKAFDARADGFARGEGAGAIVLKPATAAARDGDRVIALIRGTAVNHAGRADSIMAPSRTGQAAAIAAACASAGVEPSDLDYVELHGTGTPRGDPVEAAALGDTVGRGRPAQRPCAVGSVKTNIGHLDSAAGIAALIKTALALERGAIPPSLHFRAPNPAIDVAALGLRVQTQLGPWPDRDGPRLAGVTSLSFGGVNTHAVLEGPPAPRAPAPPGTAGRPVVVAVSAESTKALGELLLDHAALLRAVDAPDPADVAYSAALHRTHRPLRAAVAGCTREELATGLERAARRAEAAAPAAADPEAVFVLSGQGGSWQGMGRALSAEEPVFAASLDECDEAVGSRLGWSLRAAIDGADPRIAADGDPACVQPALCALQIALVALWRSWGIAPAAVVGHSLGEIAAAHVAGALPLEAALRLAAARGAVMAQLHGRGRTAQIALDPERTAELIDGRGDTIWVAAVNAPGATVVAGAPAAVEELVARVKADGVAAAILPVRSAFHGIASQPLGAQLRERVGELPAVAPAIEMLSTLTAAPLVAAPDVGYWVQQMVRPVRFRDAIRRLVADGRRTFVEVGPHPVLRSSIVATLRDAGVAGAAVASTRRDGDEAADVRAGLARLYELGFAVDWRAAQRGGRRVDLPRYRWQRERLWLDGGPAAAAMGDAAPAAGSQAGGSITHGEGDRIAAVLAEVLGRSAVPLEQSLADLGFDSLMAAELRVRIEAETGCRVAMLTLLRAPTVGALLTAVAAAVSAPAG